jgi:hypothetical protein
MDDDRLTTLRRELTKQDEALALAIHALDVPGDVSLSIPVAFTEELETLCAPPPYVGVLIVGVRS